MLKRFATISFLLVFTFALSVMTASLEPMVVAAQRAAGVERTSVTAELTHDTVVFVTSWRAATWTDEMERAYTDDEHTHLDDVRVVFRVVRWVFLFCISALIVCCLRRRSRHAVQRWTRDVRHMLSIVTFLLVGVSVTAIWWFEPMFTAAHGLLFASGTWVFPSSSKLIQLFPQLFWQMWSIGLLVGTIALMWLIQVFCPRREAM